MGEIVRVDQIEHLHTLNVWMKITSHGWNYVCKLSFKWMESLIWKKCVHMDET